MSKDLTIQELARIVGRHPETLRRLARMGELPGAYRLGHCWLISREAADRLRRMTPTQPDEHDLASQAEAGVTS
jgi:excisionase family DNA binding protein